VTGVDRRHRPLSARPLALEQCRIPAQRQRDNPLRPVTPPARQPHPPALTQPPVRHIADEPLAVVADPDLTLLHPPQSHAPRTYVPETLTVERASLQAMWDILESWGAVVHRTPLNRLSPCELIARCWDEAARIRAIEEGLRAGWVPS